MRLLATHLIAAASLIGVAQDAAAAANSPGQAKPSPAAANQDIAHFNSRFAEAIRNMDNKAVVALWDADGIALLPDSPPVKAGEPMRAMLQAIHSAHPAARMDSFSMNCFDVEQSGPWASEWCLEHQVVSEAGKPTFDSWGKMLLVLRRHPDGSWKLVREMWNHAVAPKGADGAP